MENGKWKIENEKSTLEFMKIVRQPNQAAPPELEFRCLVFFLEAGRSSGALLLFHQHAKSTLIHRTSKSPHRPIASSAINHQTSNIINIFTSQLFD
jgi:hypothetical protein